MASVVKRNQTQAELTRRSEALGDQIAAVLSDHRTTITNRPVHDGLKLAAVLCLYTQAGWQLERIGQLFGHPKGHVTRIRTYAVNAVRKLMHLNPLVTHHEPDDFDPFTAKDEADMVESFRTLGYHAKKRALAAVLNGGDGSGTW
jgi:hypothetical protein